MAARAMRKAAIRVRGTVTGSRLRISAPTGTSYWIERPRSPQSALPIHSAYWTGSGRLSPIASRSRAAASGLASVPMMISAGSPGRTRITTKTRIETKKRVAASAAALRRMKLRIGRKVGGFLHILLNVAEVLGDVLHRRLEGFVHLSGVDVLVLMNDPIPQSGARRQTAREVWWEHLQRSQADERFVVVCRRRVARLYHQVVVDVDHPADHPLQEPLGHQLIPDRGQVVFPGSLRHRLQLRQVARDEHELANDQLAVDHGAVAEPASRATNSRSRSKYFRWS